MGDILLLADTIEELVVAVGHDHMHTNEVVNGTEATGRDVTLWQHSALAMCQFHHFSTEQNAPCTGQARSPPREADPGA